MPSLDEIKRAGLETSQSGAGDQILSLMSGVAQAVPAEIQKRQEREKAETMDQVKLYAQLREAGYSAEDATAKVQRTYRSTSFIERLLRGKGNAFQAPGGEDKIGQESRKTEAEIGKIQAETGTIKSRGAYYDRGGASGQGYEKLTPNQIQTRIKTLKEDMGMGSEEDDLNLQAEIDYLNELFNKKSGFRKEAPDAGAADPAAGRPSDKTTVVMTGPDGNDYRIPKQNIARAKSRGFKDKKPVR
jgi:hypothetical protein